MPKKKSPNSVRIRNSTAEFLTFAYQTGGDGVEVRVQDGTIWLSQKNMGLLFETTPENVLMHLKNIFAGKELAEDSVAKVFLATAADGKNYRIKHYHLDAIIAVGYRVNSSRATAFRQWATGVLRQSTETDTLHCSRPHRLIQDRIFQSDFDAFVALEKRDEDKSDE